MDSSSSPKAIPRFASFKPASAAEAAPTAEANRPQEHRQHEQREHDERSHHRVKHKARHRRSRSRERCPNRVDGAQRDRSETYAAEKASPELIAVSTSTGLGSAIRDSELFVIDRKGDKFNLTYGTLHRYSIPLYHRIGGGNVIGLPRTYRIDRDSAEGDKLIIGADFWQTDAKKSKSDLWGLNKQKHGLLRIRPQIDSGPLNATQDFIPLRSRRCRDYDPGRGDRDSHEERYAYRSIHGKAKEEEDLPSGAEVASESDTGDEGVRIDPDEMAKRKNAELLRAVERTPQDVSAWLRLLDHQEVLLTGAGPEPRTLSYAEKISLADIKLSLYDKALKKVGQTIMRDRLLIGRLEEGAKLWDTRKLSNEWNLALRQSSQFITLWVKYLDFRQTEFLDFTYERCMATFLDCMKLNASQPRTSENHLVQAYLFLRMTLFMRESGFVEQAVGLWQAVLEFTCFRPSEFRNDTGSEHALSAFKEFWESEIARIGEAGAQGWGRRSASPMAPKVAISTSQIDTTSIVPSWAKCEKDRAVAARLPCRSLDELDLDDPYRIVLFSDIEEILPLFWRFDAVDALIDSFLFFCHLPPLTTLSNTNTTRHWVGDSFLQNALMGQPDFSFTDWLSGRGNDTSLSESHFMSFAHDNFIHDQDSFFAGQDQWPFSFTLWCAVVLSGKFEIDGEWTRKVLRLLVDAYPNNELLAEYSLAVEFVCGVKDARKYAKSLLRKRPSSLRLYNCYALMERRTGNCAAADNVWATTISMSRSLEVRGQSDSILLWRAWILEAFEAQETARVCNLLQALPQNSVQLSSLTQSPEQGVFSPTTILRVRNYVAQGQESALGLRNPSIFAAYTDCGAILSYLAASADLNKAVDVYNSAIQQVDGFVTSTESTFGLFTTELLHQRRAKILYHHMRISAFFKPAFIRAVLLESISLFPHNTIFLILFAFNESRFRIEGRVRDVIRSITTYSQDGASDRHNTLPSGTYYKVPITSHLFAIFTELNRPEYAGSTTHSVRSVFEKAIGELDPQPSAGEDLAPASRASSSSSPGRSNLSLWKLYILFELSRGDIQRAKEVFYRAIRACPWSKEMIMMAFTHLREDIVGERYAKNDAIARERNRKKGGPDVGLGMSLEELRQVYHVLVDRGLRIHVDIEDLLNESVVAGIDYEQPDLGHPSRLRTDGPIRMPEDAESQSEAGDGM